jgi:hypothetical protein
MQTATSKHAATRASFYCYETVGITTTAAATVLVKVRVNNNNIIGLTMVMTTGGKG